MRLKAGGKGRLFAPDQTGHRPQYVTRRRFIQGAVSGAALTGLYLWRWPAVAIGSAGGMPVLRGDNFNLTVEDVPVNFTGNSAVATAVNGSVPAPLLRWREGDTVTIAVTNRLAETSSIHWHGLRCRPTWTACRDSVSRESLRARPLFTGFR